jgi:WD40 repeat protein
MSAHNPIQGETRPKAKRYLVYRYHAFYEHPALLAEYAAQHGLETVYRELVSLRRALKDELRAPLRSLYACVMLEMLGIDMPSEIDPRRFILQQLRERAHHQGDDLLRDRCDALLAGHPHFRSLDSCRYWTVPHRTMVVRGRYPLIRHQLSDGRMLCKMKVSERYSWYWVLLHEDGSYDRELYHLGTYTFITLVRRDDRIVLLRGDGSLWLTSVDDEIFIPMEGHTLKKTLYNVYGAKELADGRMVTFGTDSFFCVWSSEGKLLLKLGEHIPYPLVVLWRDDETVWTGDGSGTLRLWSPNGCYLKQVETGDGRITRLHALIGGRMVSCDAYGYMKLWSQEGNLIADCDQGHEPSWEIVDLGDGRWLSYRIHKTSRVFAWGVHGEPLGVFGLEDNEFMQYGIPIKLPDGHICLMINRNGLRWVNLDGNTVDEVFDDAEIFMTTTVGNKVLTFGGGIWNRIWNADATPAVELRTPHCENLQLLDDNFMVITDPHFRLWDLAYAEYHEWHGHNEDVIAIHEDADGNIRTYGMDGALRIWSADGTGLAAYETHVHGMATRLGDDQFVVRKYGVGSSKQRLILCTLDDMLQTIHLEASERSESYFPMARHGRLLSSHRRESIIWNRDGSIHERIPRTFNGSIPIPDNHDILFGYDCGLRIYGDALEQVIDDGATYIGALLHSSGHVVAWTPKRFCFWSLDGTLIAEMPRHGRDTSGAVEVSDGRILSWSQAKDRESPYMPTVADLDLWSSRGELLNTIQSTEIFVEGALTRPDGSWVTWGHGAPCWWSSDGQPQRIGIGNSSCGVFALPDGRLISCGGQGIYLWSAEGKLLAAHHVHDRIMSAILHSSGVLVVGDCVGRVRFLKIV